MDKLEQDFDHGKEVLQHFNLEGARLVEPAKFDLKKLFTDRPPVNFSHFYQGCLYYTMKLGLITYQFPVPIEGCGDAKFLAQDTSALFMCYVRKAIADGTLTKTAEEFEYQVRCTECGNTFKHFTDRPLDPERLAQGGICARCSDDFK